VLSDGCNVVLRPSAGDASGLRFAVSEPKVDITKLSPASAKTGTTIRLHGVGFNDAATVKFGHTPATLVRHKSSAVLDAVVPHAAITGPVIVTNPNPHSRITSACTFRVLPKIMSFTPHSGITGSTVTVRGSGLIRRTQVLFDGRPGRVVVASANQLKVLAAAGAVPGRITVKTADGSATTSHKFLPTLSITAVSPDAGAPGTTVSIAGIGFNRTSTVKFNGVPATSVKPVSATQLTAVAPDAPTGLISVTNTSAPTGTVTSEKAFEHIPGP
jgi:voltage-gated potassium channel Kch